MRVPSILVSTSLLVSLLASATGALPTPPVDWPQWGGPSRDFSLPEATGLATSWPEEGPPILWRRALGDNGHSTILVEGDRFYVTFRRGEQEVVLAARTDNGAQIWERAYDTTMPEDAVLQFGPGPHATPLLAGDRLFVVSASAVARALDKDSGEVLWSKDLLSDPGIVFPARGYGASPVAWKDLLIVNGGGEGLGVVALRQSDGALMWQSLDGGPSYASPLLLEIDGVRQIVATLGSRRAGLDPDSGAVLWQIDLPDTAATTMATPIQVGDNQIFASSAYADGSRLIEVRRHGDDWHVEEKWYSRKLQVMHQTAARFGSYVYGSSGDFGPTFLAAVDIETGALAFRQRGFAKANLMRVGEHLLILDEDGTLALGRPSPEGVEVLAEASVIGGVSWSAPTLVGTTLFVRNRAEIMALDLAAGVAGAPARAIRTTDTATGGPDSSADAVASIDAAAAVPPRSDAGLTLEVPESLLAGGLAYYVRPGEEAQILVRSDAPLQRNVLLTSRAVGFFVAPFDLEERPDATPVLAGALRIPLASFEGAYAPLRALLLGPQGLHAAEHPEIEVALGEVREVSLERDAEGGPTYHFQAELTLVANARQMTLTVPAELQVQRATMDTMVRYVGDLAFLRSSFELDPAPLGLAVPPPLQGVLTPPFEVDLFLAFSTVTPDKTLDPAISQGQFARESRYLVLARDLGDDVAAYRHAREYLQEVWDDDAALERLAYLIVAEPGIERRPLGLALQAAERADELTDGRDALLLNTLARIAFERGDLERAIAVQERALELIDEQQPQGRGALQANLDRYRAAAGE